MRADKAKVALAMARACVSRMDIAVAAKMPENTVKSVLQGQSVRPATLGRVARVLGVDPAELLAKEAGTN